MSLYRLHVTGPPAPCPYVIRILLKGECVIKGTQYAVQWSYGIKDFDYELMVEINSKSLVRAIGKVLCMRFS